MARIRYIKPDFFFDEKLSQISSENRLAFVGLWCHADREGRLRDSSQWLKAVIFPYDDVDFEQYLMVLANYNLIERYEIDGKKYIQITNFLKHQKPHHLEPPSSIPSKDGNYSDLGEYPNDKRRKLIYERDNYICVYCGINLKNEPRKICLDHVIPLSKNGSNSDKNIVTSCKQCNAKKLNYEPEKVGLKTPKGYGLTVGQQYVNDKNRDPNMEKGMEKGMGSKREVKKDLTDISAKNAETSKSDLEVISPKKREIAPQVEFCERFKTAYESMTGMPYTHKKEHFILSAKLIKAHGMDAVVQKAKILGHLCRDQTSWFTRDGWADFTIEKLSSMWNSIIPHKDKSESNLEEAMRKQEEHNERVSEALQR